MNIPEIVKILTDAGIEQNEANAEVKIMIQDICRWTPTDIITDKAMDLSKLNKVEEVARERAKTRRPLQQLLGRAYFYGNFYKVNQYVLIPRDETEILVRKAINIIKDKHLKDILDIGTGSGCIACSIAANTDTYVLGIDISSEALRTALENASYLNLNNKAVFRKSDIYTKLHDNEKFDMIISNPPYIPNGTPVQKEVEFDPPEALFTEDDEGLEFYKKIISGASLHIKSDGYILFECGQGQAIKIRRLLAGNGFGNIEIEKDLAGINRVVTAQFLE